VTERPGESGKAGADRRAKPVLGRRARLGSLQRAILRDTRVAPFLAIQRAYDQSGGGMLSASLAFFAFFTILPALLLFTSILGVAVEDPALRTDFVERLVGRLQPLEPVVTEIMNELAKSARTATVVGVLGLLWGAAGFYGVLESSMLRMFPGPGERDVVALRVRGILAVALVLTGMLAAIVLTVVVPIVTGVLRLDLGAVSVVVAPVIACTVGAVSCLVVYVAVPPDGPSLGVALVPALAAGTVIGLLTTLFSVVAPHVVSSYVTLGIVGSVFVALVWFNLVFQILLYGAAFARLRRDERKRVGPPTL
jgi:membrane protein